MTIQTDKIAHFGLSSALTIFGFSIYMDWWKVAGVVFLIGVVKEIFDCKRTGYVSLGDILANVAGIGFAIICLRRILFLVWF